MQTTLVDWLAGWLFDGDKKKVPAFKKFNCKSLATLTSKIHCYFDLLFLN